MGEKTGITWTDHTFNPWIGCTKVSPGCAHCYAETQNKRYNWTAGWGKGQLRQRTSESNWKKPIAWARQAVLDGVIRRVFCASLADVFDNEVAPAWRNDLFHLIDQTGEIGGLEWLLLTKRPYNLPAMLPEAWGTNPPLYTCIGTTIEDQKQADMRIPLLLDSWKGKNFLSVEPMLGPLDLTHDLDGYKGNGLYSNDKIHWVIVGGESGPGCRPMDLEWARGVRDQCIESNVPFFFKQIGGFPDKKHLPEQWPEDLRIQQFPT